MGKLFWTFLALMFLFFGACSTPENNAPDRIARVRGEIKQHRGQKIFLVQTDPQLRVIDSTTIVADTFVFEIPIKKTDFFCLRLSDQHNCSPFFAGEGLLQLEYSDENHDFKAINSEVNQFYYNFLEEIRVFENKKHTLVFEYNKATQNNDTEEQQLLCSHIRGLDSALTKHTQEYIMGNIHAPVTPYLAYRYFQNSTDTAFMKLLIADLKKTHSEEKFISLLEQKYRCEGFVLPQKVFGDNPLTDTANTLYTLDLFKGKTLVFWASWMPGSLSEAARMASGNTDSVWFVSFDYDPQNWIQEIRKQNIPRGAHLRFEKPVDAAELAQMGFDRLPVMALTDSLYHFSIIRAVPDFYKP